MSRRWEILRLLRGRLAGKRGSMVDFALRRQHHAFHHAQIIVNAFYCCNLLLAAWQLGAWNRWQAATEIRPLWPVAWVCRFDVPTAAQAIVVVNALAAVMAVLSPHRRIWRFLALVGVLQTAALENSFGKVNHADHAWLWTCFFLVFLPSGPRERVGESRAKRQQFLNVLWAAQFAILLFYSMSGALKVLPIPIQLLRGEVSALAPEALARHITRRLLQTDSQSMLGTFFVSHVWLAWPFFLAGMMLELFAVVVAFRPALHRLWGAGLICLHVAIGLSMDIWFPRNILLVALLLVNSPFAPQMTLRLRLPPPREVAGDMT